MTTPARASVRSTSNSRRVPRCPLSVPVRVTVRDSHGPQGIPGRSLDLGEGGIAAILSGEVHAGDTVGVEFLLPEMGLGLHTKAVVRHHADLRCGLEFFGLSLEQQAMIRRWTRRMLEKQQAAVKVTSPLSDEPAPARFQVELAATPKPPRRKWLVKVLTIAAVLLAGTGLVAWQYWHREWAELQQQADSEVATTVQRVKLPPGAMDSLILNKVDAVYPDGRADSTSMVLVHIVIGADGTVIDARPESGPEASTRAAMEAVKEWRFQPYRVDGTPAEVETTVAVAFHQ